MKNIIVKILLIIAAFSLPYKAMAQDLTEEEKTFLKSLSGKWRACSDCKAPFGYSPLDFTIKYFNGYLKILYPKSVWTGGDEPIVTSNTLNAYYDKSTGSVNYYCETSLICSDGDEIKLKYYIAIPFQTDIDDFIIINCRTIHRTGDFTEEKMLYKQ